MFYADPTWNAERLIKFNEEEKQQIHQIEVETYGRYGENEETLMNEGSPEMIMNYIVKCILQPAFDANVQVDILCVKVRWDISPKKMQQYLQGYPDIKDKFVVLYSVQAIPNVPSKKVKPSGLADGRSVIRELDGSTRKKNQYGAMKGMFHFLIMKRAEYQYIPYERTQMYEEEVIQSHEVYVLENTFLKGPFQPRYTDHMPIPTVQTRQQYNELPTIDKQKYIKIGPGKTWEQVTNLDIENFINELKDLKGKYNTGTEEIKTEVKIQAAKIFELCKKYIGNPDYKKYTQISELKREVTSLRIIIDEGWQEAGNRSITGTRVDLSDLIHQLVWL